MIKHFHSSSGCLTGILRKAMAHVKSKTLFAALCLCASMAPVQAQDTSVFDQIIDNVIQQETKSINISSEDSKTKDYLAKLNDDGSFPDIAYSSTSQTNWAPISHLDRMKSMILSYITPASEYYANEDLYTAIVNTLNCWYAKNPTSTNWYMWEIGWPQRMGVNLSLMRAGTKQVPADVETKILNRMKSISKGPNQPGSQGTGANKMDIALQWIYRTALQRDKTNLDFAVDQFYLPLKFNTGEGLQSDYSYLQHGQQLYIGGYGASVLSATFKVSFYLVGTEYAGGEGQKYINDFVYKTYVPCIRGQYMLYGSIGRGFARKGGTGSSGFAGSLEKMKILDPDRAEDYEKGIQRLRGKQPASYGVEPYHRHFWRGDYTLHQRPDYTMDVRMASTRTYRCENGNGENLLGYFITEGGTQIVQRGDEYVDIYPVWDWTRLPGTTTPAVPKVPQPAQWGQSGQSKFTGGVSDSIYGVTVYQMVDNTNGINTSGKKAWFFFDNEVVCLGNDIKSSNANAINTTVNQCLLHGDVTVQEADGEPATVEKGERSYDKLTWVNHDGISYYFPEQGALTLRNNSQSGTWNSICNNAGDASTVTKDVFKLWFDHGVKPQEAAYSYYIVPNSQTIEEAKGKLDDIVVINTDSIQATYNKSLQILGVIFHKKSMLKLGDIEMSTSAPCVAMFRDINSEDIKAYVADPSYSQDSLTLYMKFPSLRYKMLGCKLNTTTHYAGTTHSYTVNAETPDSVYIKVDEVRMSQTAVELSYAKLFDNIQATVYPTTASNKEITWTSSNDAVVKVDNHGNLLAVGKGEAVVTASTYDGVTGECTVKVDGNLLTTISSDDAYVYDGGKTNNYASAKSIVVRTDGTNYNRMGFIKFSLDTLDGSGLEYGTLKAKLRLYVSYGAINVTEAKWRFYPTATNSWKETTLNWNNKPLAVTSKLVAQRQCFIPKPGFVADNYIELDLTDYILEQYKSGSKTISLYIDQDKKCTAGKGTSEFSSKESDEPLQHPRLYFQVDIPDGVETVAGATAESKPYVEGNHICIRTGKPCTIGLYDMQGALLQSKVSDNSGEARLFIGNLSTGAYILKVGKKAYKFVL